MRRLKENTVGKTKEDELSKEMREKIDKLGIKVYSLKELLNFEVDKTIDHQKAIEILAIKEEAKKILKIKEEGKVIKGKRNESIVDPIEAEVIKEMNKQYAIVHTSSTHVLMEKGTAGFILDSRSSLIHLHENDFFINSEGKKINKARLWLQHSLRRTYFNIVFEVDKPSTFKEDGKEVYNIFKGYAFKPKQGDASLYWHHLKYVICSGNEELYLYVRKRLASIIQKPKVLGCAIVLRGKQGTGKNQCIEPFCKLFGNHSLTFTSLDRLTGRFNSHLQYALVLFANEATWGGNKKEIGALKSIITDTTIFIEGKGKDGFQIENARHLLVASNEDWVVPRDMDDRRFLVLDVSSKHKEDHKYFAALDKQMNEGGYEALLYDLKNEDLSNFNPRIMPINDAGFDMKIKSAPTSVQYIYAVLNEKCWHIAGSEEHWEFETSKPCLKIYDNYRDWCESQKIPIQTIQEFGKIIKHYIPRLEKRKPGSGSSRANTYFFPSLKECRKDFQEITKQTDKIWSDN